DAVSMRKAWTVAPGPLDPKVVAGVEAELQKTAPDRCARDANELAAILDDLGDLTREEIVARSVADADALIESLRAEGRITEADFSGGRRAWIPTADAMHYAALATDAGLERVTLRLLRTRGPATAEWLAARYGLTREEATATLDRLAARGPGSQREERAAAPAAARRVVCAGSRAGRGPRHGGHARFALGAVLGGTGHTRHVQRDRGRQRAVTPGGATSGASRTSPASWCAPRTAGAPACDRPLERADGRGGAIARRARRGARA